MSHPSIVDALEQRSSLWHRATSTVVREGDKHDYVSTARARAALRTEAYKAGEYLVKMIARHTADNKPPYPNELYRDGKIAYVLQWVHGDTARYVPPTDFNESQFCIEMTSREERLRAEIITMREVALMEALERTQAENAPIEDDED